MKLDSGAGIYFSPQIFSRTAILRVKDKDTNPDTPFTLKINDLVSFSLDGKYFVVNPGFDKKSLEKLNIDVVPKEGKKVKVDQRWGNRDWQITSGGNQTYINSLWQGEDYDIAKVGENVIIKQYSKDTGYIITKTGSTTCIDDMYGNKCFVIKTGEGRLEIRDEVKGMSYLLNCSPTCIQMYEYFVPFKYKIIEEIVNYADRVEARNYKGKNIQDIIPGTNSIKIDERFSDQCDYLITDGNGKICVDQLAGNNDFEITT